MTLARFPRKTGTATFRGEPVQIRQLSASEKQQWADLAGEGTTRAQKLEAIHLAIAYGLDPPLTLEEARDAPEDLAEALLEPILKLSGISVRLSGPSAGKGAAESEEGASGPKG